MIPRLTVLLLAALLLPCACARESTESSERNAQPPEAGSAPGGFVVNPKSGLRTLEVGAGSRAFILLHGYGASPEEWVPFAETIRVAKNTRFVFPEAHESTTPPDGPAGGRAWWRLDLARYLNRGEPLPDLSGSRPEGIDVSNQKIRALLRDLESRLGASDGPPILGGYSQGAMVAADVAFTTDEPLKALVILSGTFVDEAGWTKGMAQRRGLPVFICHGENDDILQYSIAIRLRDAMNRAGLQVTWIPFAGGHEVPAQVVTALNKFLDNISSSTTLIEDGMPWSEFKAIVVLPGLLPQKSWATSGSALPPDVRRWLCPADKGPDYARAMPLVRASPLALLSRSPGYAHVMR